MSGNRLRCLVSHPGPALDDTTSENQQNVDLIYKMLLPYLDGTAVLMGATS
ncbi:hypothetical protein [Mesorhizobium sp. CAU 1732]|uniref:hypothetical protein n=1 Tax=Mesorhizobium sp. CAU 1732 TaxID=3140358 RepID=UPI0032618464